MTVQVQWKNLRPEAVYAFRKLPRTDSFPPYPFDLRSLMQYHMWGGGLNQRPALTLVVSRDLRKGFDRLSSDVEIAP
jgi:hypothetical protein